MSKKKKIILLSIPLVLVISFFALKFWAQEECLELEVVFTEDFNTVDFKDEERSSVQKWGEGYITLRISGIFQHIPKALIFPIWVDMVAYADFDEDGYTDVIGSSYNYYKKVVFLKNKIIDEERGFEELSPAIYNGGNASGRQPCLVAGDFDNDGHQDFMYVVTSKGSDDVGDIATLYFFEHEGSVDSNGVPQFTLHDHTTELLTSGLEGFGWTATHVSIDIDGDGDIDILFANGYGKVILMRNDGTKPLSDTTKFSTSVLIDAKEGEPLNRWDEKGITVIGTGDFDKDEDVDMIVGAANWRGLKYYKNDGTGNFSLYQVLGDLSDTPDLYDNYYDGAATAIGVADYDGDGDLDFMIGTDNWLPQEDYPPNYYTGANRRDCGQYHGTGTRLGGKVFYFKNDGTGEFDSTLAQDGQQLIDAGECAAWDLDFGFPIDFDNDGDEDFVVFDGNQSAFYYCFENVLSNRYNLDGTGVSKNITVDAFPPDGISQEVKSITKMQFTEIQQSVMGMETGVKITYYVSNNGGKDWEFYAEFEEGDIHNYTDLPVHIFSSFGADLRWKAVFSSLTDHPDLEDEFYGTSDDTPRIDSISIKYFYVDKKEYSRTSVVSTNVMDGSDEKKLIIGGTFIYPSWEGHLRAYDMTGMAPSETTQSVIRTVTEPDLSETTGREIVAEGVEILWDAGELLASRAASARIIYTDVPGASGLERKDFSTAELAALGPILADVNNDNEGLINFIRGEGRTWKLGDINHSNPIAVGPPDGSPDLKGDYYQDFLNANQNRQKVLYVGANDGMLHCFDVLTGTELWAFIPYNLLPKLKNMWAVAPSTGERYFNRDNYVDGTPMVEDVYIDADGDSDKEWITILICGQGPGKGSTIGGGDNYYFALDVTDPTNPQPLWEFTDYVMGETWSVPVVGKVKKKEDAVIVDTWAGFMGSGYDNVDDHQTGNRFYAVKLETGEKFWDFTDAGVDTITKFGFTWDIANAFVGSPALIDTDQDGYADRVYFGDLDGRMWRVDVSVDFIDTASWTAVNIYEDSNNYPILSKPVVWVKPGVVSPDPRIYFGTGGDDDAPSTATYSFIALVDGSTPEVEWFIGDNLVLGLPSTKDVGDLTAGEKVWADPKVANFIVYFSTLKGNIESVDPCENILGIGRLYARYIQTISGTLIGGTAFKPSATTEYLELAIKTRAAVTLGERARTQSGSRKREVYIQEYDSTIQRLEQSIVASLKIGSWREIFRIIK